MDRPTWKVDADIATAESLPPEVFTSAAFDALERATLWRDAWTLVLEHTTQEVEAPGARVPFERAGAPFFLQRDMEGTLRAFPNVCTHAWHTLVAAPEQGKLVRCPQHGRNFDTQGRCIGQPGMPRGTVGFPRPVDHLRPLAATTWGPFCFAGPGGTPGPALPSGLAHIEASLGRLRWRSARPATQAPDIRTVDGNWKQHAANYLDQLHIPFIHGEGLGQAVRMGSYRTRVYDDAVLQWAEAKDPGLGFDPDAVPHPDGGRSPIFALWWFLWPNLTLNFYPWGLSVNRYDPAPGDPTRTRFHWQRYLWDDAMESRQEDWHLSAVDAEDVAALREVRRGLLSGEAVRGRFVPDAEKAVHWFHRRVYEAVSA